MRLGSRLKNWRKDAGYTQKETVSLLAKKGFEINQGTLSNWELDNREPSLSVFIALCDIYGIIDIRYALTGINIRSSAPEAFAGLNPAGRQHAEDVINLMLGNPMFTEIKRKIIRLYGLPVSAGTGQYLDSSDYEDLEIEAKEVPDGTDFAVRVSGDSMLPKFADGDILFIREQAFVNDGDIGIFAFNNDAFCKKLIGNELHSLNKNYKPIKIRETDEIRTYGKVIGKITHV